MAAKTNTTTVKVGQPHKVKPGSVAKNPINAPVPAPVPRVKKTTVVVQPAPAPSKTGANLPGDPPKMPPGRIIGRPDPRDMYVAQPRRVRLNPNPNIVTMLLLSLVVVNGFAAGHFQKISGVVSGKNTSPQSIHSEFLVLGGELVFVVALSMLAETSEGASGPILALTLVLWLLWAIQNGKHIRNFVSSTTPVAPPTPPQKSTIPGVPGPYTP